MKNILFALLFLLSISAAAGTAHAQQCDRSRMTPIKCGYYEEGYQDGVNDARNNADNDHRRYRSKFESQYESFYRSGYDEGYASIKPFARWTDSQKNTYDQGYDDGQRDRSRNISRLPARYEGQYDRINELYYQAGYFDGYDNRPKKYDRPLEVGTGRGTGGVFPTPIPSGRTRGTSTGIATWNGRVDNRVNVIIKGDTINAVTIAGPFSTSFQNLTGVLPRRNSTLSVTKVDGRGTVFVLQQPNRSNDFTGIVQIYDPRRGQDNYRLQIRWTSSNVDEPYSAGRVTWRGRVDASTLIRISGDFVESIDEWQTGLTNVSYDLAGYLAARPGSVRVSKREGRGTVSVLQQPSADNDFTAVIRVFDEGSGADNYQLDIVW